MAWRSAALNCPDGLDLLEEAALAMTAILFYPAEMEDLPRTQLYWPLHWGI
jgi:hypothetical protein